MSKLKCRSFYSRASLVRYRQQLQSRLTFGTILSVVIDLGLMSSFAPPNPNYGISLDKAREKVVVEIGVLAHVFFNKKLCDYAFGRCSWPFGMTKPGPQTCNISPHASRPLFNMAPQTQRVGLSYCFCALVLSLCLALHLTAMSHLTPCSFVGIEQTLAKSDVELTQVAS